MSLDNNLEKKFGENFSENVNLSNYSWFNLGGNAEYFFKAKNKTQLIDFLKELKNKNLKKTILGAGSNTLFRDNGVKGVVIKLGSEFSYVRKVIRFSFGKILPIFCFLFSFGRIIIR